MFILSPIFKHLHDLLLLLLRKLDSCATLECLLEKTHELILIHWLLTLSLSLSYHWRYLPLLTWASHKLLVCKLSISRWLHCLGILLLILLHHHILLLAKDLLLLCKFGVRKLIWVHHDHLLGIYLSKHHLLLVWQMLLLHLHWITSKILWNHHTWHILW